MENNTNEEVSKQPVNYDAINKETFKDVNYQDLLKTFTDLGLESAWKPGKSKDYMVKLALKKCAELKELKSQGIEGEKASEIADKNVEIKDALQEAEVKIAAKKEQETSVNAREKELNRIKSMDLSADQLERALENTNANLKNNPSEAQRSILLMKQSILHELLDIK